MRDETAAWLQPMVDAAETQLAPGVVAALRQQATMPMAESDIPTAERSRMAAEASAVLAGVLGAEAAVAKMRAIDWIQFGNLLRAALGWEDRYPDRPPSSN